MSLPCDCSLRVGRVVRKALEMIRQCKDVFLTTKSKIILTTVFPIIMYGGESWTVEKADRQKELIHLDESFMDWKRVLLILAIAKMTNKRLLCF